MGNAIQPQHESMRGKHRVPRDFGTQRVTLEQREALERVALDTFTDMVNAGHTFQTAMAAVYFSGFTHALEASDEMRRSA